MKITTVTYRTNVELAPYRHAHVEMTAELEKGEDSRDALEALKTRVHQALGIDITEADVKAAREVLKKAERLYPKVRGRNGQPLDLDSED